MVAPCALLFSGIYVTSFTIITQFSFPFFPVSSVFTYFISISLYTLMYKLYLIGGRSWKFMWKKWKSLKIKNTNQSMLDCRLWLESLFLNITLILLGLQHILLSKKNCLAVLTAFPHTFYSLKSTGYFPWANCPSVSQLVPWDFQASSLPIHTNHRWLESYVTQLGNFMKRCHLSICIKFSW